MGIHKQDLKGRTAPDLPAEVFDELLSTAPALTQEADLVRLKSHKVVLKMDEEQARAAIETAFERAGLATPPSRKCLRVRGWKLRGRAPCCRSCCVRANW